MAFYQRVLTAAWLIAALLSGCSVLTGRAETEGAGVILGPRGSFVAIDPSDTTTPVLDSYHHFRVGTFVGEFQGAVPDEFYPCLSAKLEKHLQHNHLSAPLRRPRILIRGTILHYETAPLKSELFTPLEEVVARVECVDERTGRVVASANCVGRTMETINLGHGAKAEGLAKAIVAWIQSLRKTAATSEPNS